MYKTIAEFVEDWTKESAISLKVQRALTGPSLQHKSDPEGNTLGKIACHMVVMIGMTGSVVRLEIFAPARGTEPPSSANSIADAYQTSAQSMTEQASTKLKDGQFVSEVSYFGRTLPMAAVLTSLIPHQIHHRGQMTILMRQAERLGRASEVSWFQQRRSYHIPPVSRWGLDGVNPLHLLFTSELVQSLRRPSVCAFSIFGRRPAMIRSRGRNAVSR
jgi:uncharacterized damage-inducible protein DinB